MQMNKLWNIFFFLFALSEKIGGYCDTKKNLSNFTDDSITEQQEGVIFMNKFQGDVNFASNEQ